MTGAQVREARSTLGKMWGLPRPLHASELARALRLQGRDPGATVLAWESGTPVSGPASVAIDMMLAGYNPATKDDIAAIRALVLPRRRSTLRKPRSTMGDVEPG